MLEDGNKINLTDLIDLELLQEFQDILGKVLNVASITVGSNKQTITKPSGFSNLCLSYTSQKNLGIMKCVECDLKWGDIAAEKGEPIIYTCHAGLTNFAVPIIVEGNHIGTILGGQVFTEPPNEDDFREIARKIKIDEDKYIEALREIKVLSLDHLKVIAQLFFIVANAISKLGHKNFDLYQRNNSEKLYLNITKAIRSTLDIDETKQKIVDIIGKTLGADRCFIVEYDKEIDTFLIVKDEYVSSPNIPKYSGNDANEDVPNFLEEFKKGNYLVIKDKEIFINEEKREFKEEQQAIKKYNVNSAYAFPLFHNDIFIGILAIHYLSD